MIHTLYRLLTTAASPLILAMLARRRARGKEDRARQGERLGIARRRRPDGPLVWLHGASVGESISALPLINRILEVRPDLNILVTTGTVTSARLMEERLPKGAFHQYVPVDRAAWVARFLDHWRPNLALWMESELWPNLVRETQRRGVPMALINGRMSKRSLRGWRHFSGLVRSLLRGFDICLVQSQADGARYVVLGARNVECPGNLKFAAAPLPADDDELARVWDRVGDRPLWLAASTHAGEETIVAQAHQRLMSRHPGLLTVIAPRHMTRGAEIAAELEAIGLTVARRGAGDEIEANTDIYIADTMGELGLLYRLAGVVFVGGSLVPRGGQNLLEPAQLDCAVVHGPYTENFHEIVTALDAAAASEEVRDARTLADTVDRLLADPVLRQRRAAAAREVALGQRDVLDNVMAALAPYLATLLRPDPSKARART
jgi:3-deoxy-D-manno-octulosonic-acid transferase